MADRDAEGGDLDGLASRALAALDALTTAEGWPLASAPASPDEPVGRFAALFGRDALITSLQVLPVRPAMAAATLAALGGRRGTRTDAVTGEEPGKILHEERELAPDWMLAAGYPVRPDRSSRWYWSVDATPLFLVLAAMAGAGGPAVAEAIGWLERALEPTGLLTYAGHARGLEHQGWRDATPARAAVAGIAWPDGRGVDPPVAVASAQAFAYAALRAHGRDEAAAALADRFDRAFYGHGAPWPALAVDGRGAAVGTLASEIGIPLWAGLLRPCRVEGAVAALGRLLTPWGLRTVGPDHARFDPSAYHYGAVWPFENWFAWGGLRAAGAAEAAGRVRHGVLDAVGRLGRMPECYAVPVQGSGPVILAESNRTQAWTAGAVWALEAGWDGRPRYALPTGGTGQPNVEHGSEQRWR
jgi:glycogen debranching enzyme